MRCPYCGSDKLVWRDGQIVCSSCGSVIDRVYDGISFFEPPAPKSGTKYKVAKEEFPTWTNVVYYNGAVVREDSLPALKLIESSEIFLLVYDMINSSPLFSTKTAKTKLAVGLYLYDKELFKKYRLYLGVSEKRVLKALSGVKRRDREKIRGELKKRMGEFLS